MKKYFKNLASGILFCSIAAVFMLAGVVALTFVGILVFLGALFGISVERLKEDVGL